MYTENDEAFRMCLIDSDMYNRPKRPALDLEDSRRGRRSGRRLEADEGSTAGAHRARATKTEQRPAKNWGLVYETMQHHH
jgi:hypothetical protein